MIKESLGLRTRKKFGVRTMSKKMPHKKYIFVYEGEKTESLYFEGLFNNREELNIQKLIEFTPLKRSDGTRSHQLEIVVNTQKFLNQILSCQHSQENIKKEIISQLSNVLDLEIVEMLIEEHIKFYDLEQEIELFIEALNEVLKEHEECINIISQIKKLKQFIKYKVDYDEVCIILDRDFKSFKESQYDEVLEICKNKKYRLGLTNPCFEFWLLLHFNNCIEYDPETIRKNPKVTKKKRYLEQELSNLDNLSGYRKNRLNFDNYINYVSSAIENAKAFSLDLEELKNDIGSTVGCIIEELME